MEEEVLLPNCHESLELAVVGCGYGGGIGNSGVDCDSSG